MVETWNLLAVEVADIAVCGVVTEDRGFSLLRIRKRISQNLGLGATMLVTFDVLVPTSPWLIVVWIGISLLLGHAFSGVSLSHSILWLAVSRLGLRLQDPALRGRNLMQPYHSLRGKRIGPTNGAVLNVSCYILRRPHLELWRHVLPLTCVRMPLPRLLRLLSEVCEIHLALPGR